MPWQALLEFAAAMFAAMLAAALFLNRRLHRGPGRTRLAGVLLAIAWLLTTFMLVDQGWIMATPLLQLTDTTLALLFSALFVDYLATALGRGRRTGWCYLLPVAFLLAAVLGGEPVLAAAGIDRIIYIQIIHTAVATGLWLAALRQQAKPPKHLVYLLAALWCLHVAQVSRMLYPGVGWVFDAVPLVGTAIILGLTFLVISRSRALQAAAGGSHAPASEWTLDALDAFLIDRKPFLDAGLKVNDLAQAAGLPARQLSGLINRSTGGNFYAYINRHRVEEARRILADPGESDTCVEAVGLMVGFKARSTFYQAFRRATGQTPADYRRSQIG